MAEEGRRNQRELKKVEKGKEIAIYKPFNNNNTNNNKS